MNDIDNDPVYIPIDGILDLHMFSPKDVSSVVKEYISACIEEDIYELRIIHGKGKGVLRETVHSILKKHPKVADFSLDPGSSSWGATLVQLRRK